ncbi:hypothetical protein ACFUEJ_11245 [Gordonia sp. NPDC057258]|uniref:hypothetical protein n=1 Tax=unclassified Gordonia (in: high G+C Gram-positive bacteria) TaxID=2657482 RepID=UPI003634600F
MPQDRHELINAKKVKKEMDEMVEMITHPEFVSAMKKMKEAPPEERRALAKDVLSVDALKDAGVVMPPGMRVTTRYFEPGKPDVLEIDPLGKPREFKLPREIAKNIAKNPGDLVAWGGCACGGGASFCGGAGGGS